MCANVRIPSGKSKRGAALIPTRMRYKWPISQNFRFYSLIRSFCIRSRRNVSADFLFIDSIPEIQVRDQANDLAQVYPLQFRLKFCQGNDLM